MAKDVRVVVIDDDPDLRRLIQVTLELAAGWNVTTAGDGPAGITAVRERRPHAVVVDLMMPGMDGYAVCRALKAERATAHIPLLVLTARKQGDDADARRAGAADVVFKPFEVDDLTARLRALIGRDAG
jgi:DNA-binding response OmpR family regulator